MKTAILLLSLLFTCTACARYDAARTCQKQAGGMPNQWTNSMGAIGALGNAQTPEMRAYSQSVDDCMARYDAKQKDSDAKD